MWSKGSLVIEGSTVNYWVKHYEEPSEYGIKNGRVSKLSIEIAGKIVCDYDRGWNTKPKTDEAKKAFKMILDKFN